jgi:hypothetical protein
MGYLYIVSFTVSTYHSMFVAKRFVRTVALLYACLATYGALIGDLLTFRTGALGLAARLWY